MHVLGLLLVRGGSRGYVWGGIMLFSAGGRVEGPGALRLVVHLPCPMSCLWLKTVASDRKSVAYLCLVMATKSGFCLGGDAIASRAYYNTRTAAPTIAYRHILEPVYICEICKKATYHRRSPQTGNTVCRCRKKAAPLATSTPTVTRRATTRSTKKIPRHTLLRLSMQHTSL